MKPNDKAYEAALRATSDSCSPYQIKNALDAAYAAQFQSEDYAGLIKMLRSMHKQIASAVKQDDPWGIIDETVPSKAADAIEMLLAKLNNEPKRSEDYAGLVKQLRDWGAMNYKLCDEAADALEAVLAERDALKAENNELREENENLKAANRYGKDWVDQASQDIASLRAERDALLAHLQAAADRLEKLAGDMRPPNSVTPQLFMLANSMKQNVQQSDRNARLAPVEDEALVEIAMTEIEKVIASSNDSETVGYGKWEPAAWGAFRAAIAAIRPHIEAAERERCANIAEKYENERANYLLDRSARAVATLWREEIAAAIRSGK